MENRKTTNEPYSYEAVHYENIWWDIMWHSLPHTALSLKDVDHRKQKDVYAQDGWCGNEHEKEPIVTLQPEKHTEPLLVYAKDSMIGLKEIINCNKYGVNWNNYTHLQWCIIERSTISFSIILYIAKSYFFNMVSKLDYTRI